MRLFPCAEIIPITFPDIVTLQEMLVAVNKTPFALIKIPVIVKSMPVAIIRMPSV
jgi:hypothetical protein